MKNKKLLIVIAVVGIIALWAFSGYNGMVDSQEAATTALSNVETQYQRRADMMPQLVKIVKAYAKHEKETFDVANEIFQLKKEEYSNKDIVKILKDNFNISKNEAYELVLNFENKEAN